MKNLRPITNEDLQKCGDYLKAVYVGNYSTYLQNGKEYFIKNPGHYYPKARVHVKGIYDEKSLAIFKNFMIQEDDYDTKSCDSKTKENDGSLNIKVYDALQTIQQLCINQKKKYGLYNCENCPLGTSNGICKLSNKKIPCDWEIVSPDIYRAFK